MTSSRSGTTTHTTGIRTQDWTALSPTYGFGAMDGLVAQCVCLMPAAYSVSIETLVSIQVVLQFPQTAKRLLEEGGPTSYTVHIRAARGASSKTVGVLKFDVSTAKGGAGGGGSDGWKVQSFTREDAVKLTRTFAVDAPFQLGEYDFSLDVEAGSSCAGAHDILQHHATADSNTARGGSSTGSAAASADDVMAGAVGVVASTVATADGRTTLKVAWETPRPVGGDALFELAVRSRPLRERRQPQLQQSEQPQPPLVQAAQQQRRQQRSSDALEGSVIISAFSAGCASAAQSSHGSLFGSFQFIFGTLPGETSDYVVHVRRVFASPDLQQKSAAAAAVAVSEDAIRECKLDIVQCGAQPGLTNKCC